MQTSSYKDESELLATEQESSVTDSLDTSVEKYEIPEQIGTADNYGSIAAEENEGEFAETETESRETPADTLADYEALAEKDIEELRREFHEARELRSITELDNPVRFAELREMGLSPREAYLATQKTKARHDNRSHLVGSMPSVRGGRAASMTQSELYQAREIFSGMSDTEIQALYKKVSKQS